MVSTLHPSSDLTPALVKSAAVSPVILLTGTSSHFRPFAPLGMTQRVSCLEKMLFIFQIKNKYHALWMQAITDVSVELLKGKGPRKPKKWLIPTALSLLP